MSVADPPLPIGEDGGGRLLTRQEASAALALMGVRLKPATLARLWSTGSNGPPCRHIRAKPFYPEAHLRTWAESQISDLRTGLRLLHRPDPVAEPVQTRGAGDLEVLLADPAASFASKAVLAAWRDRDPVDTMNDAETLAAVFAARVRRRIRGRA